MHCAKCKADNRESARFCDNCGTKLSPLCPSCGAENRADARFCDSCGAGLAGSAPSTNQRNDTSIRLAGSPVAEGTDGERKTVTALFADIKGSMELMEDLDPEEARAIVDPALKLMIDAAHRYDGYVVQSTGDGIFALFGAPIAHEDHPQRALYAAVRMQDEMRQMAERLRAHRGINLQVRVGVNVGEVVVRSIHTGAGQVEYTPIGHSTGLASRLQTLANPGTIAISDGLRKLVEGFFTVKALGPARIRGASELVEVYEVTGLGPLRTRLQRAAGRGLTKFVGRGREMEALKHAAEQAKGGRGQVVGAVAEAGVGKSRLFFEFEARNRSGWMVLETFSISHGKASAYLPMIELLHGYFAIEAGDDSRKRREKVTGRLLALDRSLEDTLAYLFSLIGIVDGDDPLTLMDGQVKKRRTLEAIKRIILRESLNQPLMVIFEDLHWIDEQTQEFLNLLADSIGTAKILLLVNYRPEYAHRWSSKTYYTQLRLDPLGEEGAEEMLAALVGGGDDRAALKRVIIEKTEGNPFFMEEMVLSLFDEGALVRKGEVELVRPLDSLKIPTTVQAVLASRIDRLPPAEKDLLQILSVIGREFPVSLGSAVWHHIPAGEDGGLDLQQMLTDLQLAEFIYEQPAIGDVEYVFKHALTQEVAYNSVLMERRRVIHERVGAAIEQIFVASLSDHYGELAHHYRNSGNPLKAIDYLHRAAQQAMSRSAFGEAQEPLRAALGLVPALPATIDRDRAESSLLLDIGICSIYTNILAFMSKELLANLERARSLSEKLGRDAHRCDVLSALAFLYANKLEAQKARSVCAELLEIATELNDSDMMGRALFWPVFTPLWQGDFPPVLEGLERAYKLPLSGRSRRELSFGGWQILTRSMSGLTWLLLGYPEKADARNQEALALARERKEPWTLVPTFFWSMIVQMLTRRPEIAKSQVEEGLRIARDEVLEAVISANVFLHGCTLVQLGEIEAGLRELQGALADLNQFMRSPVGSFLFPALADVYLKAGQRDQGLQTVAEGVRILVGNGTRLGEAELRRLKGELLLLHSGADDEAESSFREAIAVAQRQSAKWFELRSTISLARLLRSTGRRDEAGAILAEIYGWFTEGFDTADLKDAKALLDELSGLGG